MKTKTRACKATASKIPSKLCSVAARVLNKLLEGNQPTAISLSERSELDEDNGDDTRIPVDGCDEGNEGVERLNQCQAAKKLGRSIKNVDQLTAGSLLERSKMAEDNEEDSRIPVVGCDEVNDSIKGVKGSNECQADKRLKKSTENTDRPKVNLLADESNHQHETEPDNADKLPSHGILAVEINDESEHNTVPNNVGELNFTDDEANDKRQFHTLVNDAISPNCSILVDKAKDEGQPNTVPETSRCSDGYRGITPISTLSNKVDVTKQKLCLLNSQDLLTLDFVGATDGTEEGVCLKCAEGGQVLMCSSNDCPVVVHENCLGYPANFDNIGNFYCPFCLYKHVTVEFNEIKKKVYLAKKALCRFLGTNLSVRLDEIGKQVDTSITCHANNARFREEEIIPEEDRLNTLLNKANMHGNGTVENEADVSIEDTNSDGETHDVLTERKQDKPKMLKDNQHLTVEEQMPAESNTAGKRNVSSTTVKHMQQMDHNLRNFVEDHLQKVTSIAQSGEDLPCREDFPFLSDTFDKCSTKRKRNHSNTFEGYRYIREAEQKRHVKFCATSENSNSPCEGTICAVINDNDHLTEAEEQMQVKGNIEHKGSSSLSKGEHEQKVDCQTKRNVEDQLKKEQSTAHYGDNDPNMVEEDHIREDERQPCEKANVWSRNRILPCRDTETLPSDSDRYSAQRIKKAILQPQIYDQPEEPSLKASSLVDENAEDQNRKAIASNKSIKYQRAANHSPSSSFSNSRRKKLPWKAEEEETLKKGVQMFSTTVNKNIPWRKILEFGANVFDGTRTPVDLKDKWKNIKKAKGKDEGSWALNVSPLNQIAPSCCLVLSPIIVSGQSPT
ncbi:PREDICTED: uncharacterized protein LOC104594379 isoform X2 [Nelumbo nucifera]|uniref:Uncharacterized protein LOC104594379 isoform X2 n=1 Tax=Nelumbo nucifera TaxID=4432 RepID=A0A1U7ZIT2_NELNU|nr:PREDICTED: uncharacterized protein LOC104594379 isoform X2 [Nelumbo nucifera]